MAGAVAAQAAVWAGSGRLSRPGAAGLAELVDAPGTFLRDLTGPGSWWRSSPAGTSRRPLLRGKGREARRGGRLPVVEPGGRGGRRAAGRRGGSWVGGWWMGGWGAGRVGSLGRWGRWASGSAGGGRWAGWAGPRAAGRSALGAFFVSRRTFVPSRAHFRAEKPNPPPRNDSPPGKAGERLGRGHLVGRLGPWGLRFEPSAPFPAYRSSDCSGWLAMVGVKRRSHPTRRGTHPRRSG